MSSWFGGAIPPDSPDADTKTGEDASRKDSSSDQEPKQKDDAVPEEPKLPSDDGTEPEEGADPARILGEVSNKAYGTAKAWGSE